MRNLGIGEEMGRTFLNCIIDTYRYYESESAFSCGLEPNKSTSLGASWGDRHSEWECQGKLGATLAVGGHPWSPQYYSKISPAVPDNCREDIFIQELSSNFNSEQQEKARPFHHPIKGYHTIKLLQLKGSTAKIKGVLSIRLSLACYPGILYDTHDNPKIPDTKRSKKNGASTGYPSSRPRPMVPKV